MIQSKSDAIRVPLQMTLYVRPTARKKPNMIIIYTGTNDIQNNIDTLQKVERLLKKLMLTMKYKLLSHVSFTVMVKTSRKKLMKSTKSWRIYVRVNKLSS